MLRLDHTDSRVCQKLKKQPGPRSRKQVSDLQPVGRIICTLAWWRSFCYWRKERPAHHFSKNLLSQRWKNFWWNCLVPKWRTNRFPCYQRPSELLLLFGAMGWSVCPVELWCSLDYWRSANSIIGECEYFFGWQWPKLYRDCYLPKWGPNWLQGKPRRITKLVQSQNGPNQLI